MDIVIPSMVIGTIASLVVQLFKFIPFLAKTDLRKQLTAFLTTLLIVSGYIFMNEGLEVGWINLVGFFILSLSTAYSVYKTVWKGVATTFGFGK